MDVLEGCESPLAAPDGLPPAVAIALAVAPREKLESCPMIESTIGFAYADPRNEEVEVDDILTRTPGIGVGECMEMSLVELAGDLTVFSD